jgi:hypothetical protein
MKQALILILRGTLGGAIGGILWMFLPAVFMGILKDPWALRMMIVGYLLFGLWITAALGGLVGFIIWAINRGTGMNLGAVLRVCIGTPVAFVPMALYLFENEPPLTIFNLWYPLFFSLVVGALSALIVGRSPYGVSHSSAAEQIVGRERRERVL